MRVATSGECCRQKQGVFYGSCVVARATAYHFEFVARVETQRGKVGCAHFQNGVRSLKRLRPIQRCTQQRGTDSAAAPVGLHGKIENFKFRAQSTRDEEPGDFVSSCSGNFVSACCADTRILDRHPPRHFAARHAVVIPGGPLRDFRAGGLNRKDGFHVAGFQGANRQDG
jgi:hypothetical protein